MATNSTSAVGEWLHGRDEDAGLKRYVETIRSRLPLILLVILLTTGAAIAYVATAEKVYEAETDILISPVPEDADVLIALGLPSSSIDPLRDVQTAARLIDDREVAMRALEDLGEPADAQAVDDLLERTTVEPVAESDIVAITAEAPSAEGAAETANAFAAAAIDVRTEELHERIDAQLPAFRNRLENLPEGDTRAQLESDLAQLELIRAGQDPTLRVEAEAAPPESPVAPRPLLSIAAGLLAGVVLGVGAAFALQALDPRVRREEQLRERFRLPILARVPDEKPRGKMHPLTPGVLSPRAAEAYRTLRAMLGPAAGASGAHSRAALVTGSTGSEGKTTTAVNLATSLAAAGRSVILIEADLRRPAIGSALNVRPATGGVVSVLLGETDVEDAVVDSPTLGPALRLLLADREGAGVVELFSLPTARRMIERAKELADFVIIDSPPLTEVVDTMPLARMVDDVLILVRLSRSRLDRIAELGELLAENEIRPAGFVVVGVSRSGRDSDYYHQGLGEHRPLALSESRDGG